MTPQAFESLVRSLIEVPDETEWLEFKVSYAEPNKIGENISALSNSAALHRKASAYLVWGIEDKTHHILGTKFDPSRNPVGQEEFESWLLRKLTPQIDIRFLDGIIDGKRVVVFEIPPAPNRPVRFVDFEWIRVGSYTKKLQDFPEKARALWACFSEIPFEKGTAAPGVTSDDVLSLIHYAAYFRLASVPLPDTRSGILERLCQDRIVVRRSTDRFDVTNLGAMLFSHKLSAFERIDRKAVRVVVYSGTDRTRTLREQTGGRGYAVGFERLIDFINNLLPRNELLGRALRTEVRTYPEIAIRELVANALIHQDFHVVGAGPMIEIFSDRMEITNPGVPLIDTLRFIDEPPRSRNETLAGLLRRMGMCEERGSGIDKVIREVEVFQLPAPDFRVSTNATIAVLLGPRKFSQMNRDDRARACYQHACLLFVSGQRMTNASLRKRLGIEARNYPVASRIIRDTLEMNWIKAFGDGPVAKRDSSYVPFWA